jgi:hypothetical protein
MEHAGRYAPRVRGCLRRLRLLLLRRLLLLLLLKESRLHRLLLLLHLQHLELHELHLLLPQGLLLGCHGYGPVGGE